MPFVIDASITASRLLSDELHPTALAAFTRFVDDTAIVPAVWWFEVRNMLLVNQRRGRIDERQMAQALEMIEEIPVAIDRDPESRIVIELAERHRLSVYDAAYVELALRHQAPLATLDGSMARAAEAQRIPLIG